MAKGILALGIMASILFAPAQAPATEPQQTHGILAKYTAVYTSNHITIRYTPQTPRRLAVILADFLANTLKVRRRTTCVIGPSDDGQGGYMVRIPASWRSRSQITPRISGFLVGVAARLSQKFGSRVILVMVVAGTNRELYRTAAGIAMPSTPPTPPSPLTPGTPPSPPPGTPPSPPPVPTTPSTPPMPSTPSMPPPPPLPPGSN